MCPVGVDCAAGQCDFCTPDCRALECGDDGCGGSCGECDTSDSCVDGLCACAHECDDVACGPGACGGSCGECADDEECSEGACVCAPTCASAAQPCGDDGCGGSCGECGPLSGCIDGECVDDCPAELPLSPVGAACASDGDCGDTDSCIDICGWSSCTCDPAAPACPAWAPHCLPLSDEPAVSACMPACPTEGPCPGGLSCLVSWQDQSHVATCRTGDTLPCRSCDTEADCDLVGERCPNVDGDSWCALPCSGSDDSCAAGLVCDSSAGPGPLCLPPAGLCDEP